MNDELKITYRNLETTMLDIGQFVPSPTQPRHYFDPDKHLELTQSMVEHGFTMSVLLARPSGTEGLYELVLGERRLRAAKDAGIAKVPCIIQTLTDQQVLEMQLIENIQREDLTPLEEAEHLKRLMEMRDEKGAPLYTYESLGKRISRSADTIRQRIKLCGLDEETRREIDSGRLPPETAKLLTRIMDPVARLKATKMILHPQREAGPLSSRKAEELIHREFIRDLRLAYFDQADHTLLPIEKDEADRRVAGGACVDCPMRSGKAADVPSQKQNICLNPACYERKQQISWQRWQVANTDATKKRRATNEQESNKLYQRGNQLAPGFGLVDLSARPDGDDLKPGEDSPGTWRELTDGAELEVIVTRDRLLKTHELVDRARAIEAAVTINKHRIFKTLQRDKRKPDSVRKTEVKEKDAGREAKKAELLACMDQLQKNVTPERIIDFLRLLVDREIEYLDFPPHDAFLKRYNLPAGSVAKQIAKRPAAQIVTMLVEFIMSEGGFVYEIHENDSPYLSAFGVYRKAAKLNATAKR